MKSFVALALLAAALAGVLGAGSAQAHNGTGTHGSVSRYGVSANFSVYRHGWGAIVSLKLGDTARDHDAVYARIELDVEDAIDPDKTIWNVNGAGTALQTQVRLPAGGGTVIRGVRVTVCTNDGWLDAQDPGDDCTGTSRTLAQQAPHRPELKAPTDALMAASLATFMQEKTRRAAPYDWRDDGCSAPFLPDALASRPTLLGSFRGACERHDFGYRNYGKHLELSPTDAARTWIDSIFFKDLHAACGADAGCHPLADVYYVAVRSQGGVHYYGY